MRRSRPCDGTSSWTSAPWVRNHGADWSDRTCRWNASSSSQRTTSRPQLPKRGFTTTGTGTLPTGPSGWSTLVRGCGSPARRRSRAVRSLSCAASSALAGLSTRTPPASREPSAHRPSSTPSSVVRTSSRQSAVSPGPSSRSARSGESTSDSSPAGAAATSARFVSVSRRAIRASFMAAMCQLPPPPARALARFRPDVHQSDIACPVRRPRRRAGAEGSRGAGSPTVVPGTPRWRSRPRGRRRSRRPPAVASRPP